MKLSPNEINQELERVRTGNYRQFIKRVILHRVRGFHEQSIEYRYPVTALIGTNGGGKSTILGATAMAYKSVKPGQFFPKSFVGDNTMADWSIEYELIDKPINPNQNVSKTAKFTQSKWRRDEFTDRKVLYIEIQRTVPAGELTKFKRFLGPAQNGLVISPLSNSTITYASAVLDKDISNYRIAHMENAPIHKIYVGQSSGADYSQFHFGAGEASIIATIDRIENTDDNALVLIEEVENGLHPIAVRLFVQYLQNVARRKRLQIVFTTHSQDAIDEMPPQGIWSSINSHTWNGKLSIASLRAVTGTVPNEKVVFVEDAFVQEWTENALGRYGGDMAETTKVYPAGGYPNVVKVTQFHNENPARIVPAVGLVDGDIFDPSGDESLPAYCMFLGGGTPEATVFEYIYNNRIDLVSIVRQRCLLSAFSEDRITNAIESAQNAAIDQHVVFTYISERLNFTSALRIRSGMIDIFNERNPEFWTPAIDFIRTVNP
jgi:hypothetical protein